MPDAQDKRSRVNFAVYSHTFNDLKELHALTKQPMIAIIDEAVREFKANKIKGLKKRP